MSRMEGLFTAWGKILSGRAPNLSIEITRECPLRCPGCYAFGDDHLGGDVTLRDVADYKGDALVQRSMLQPIDEHKPVHLSIVGGEPLVRFRELDTPLPILAARGCTRVPWTSAVRPIPIEWARLPRLQIVVSIDGLQPEHDERRKPATYDRILKHIAGQQVTVHCTVTRQQVQRPGYLEEFVQVLVDQRRHAPDLGQPLHSPDRRNGAGDPDAGRSRPGRPGSAPAADDVSEAQDAQGHDRGLRQAAGVAGGVRVRPGTTTLSADLERRITPCQFGGNPDCAHAGASPAPARGRRPPQASGADTGRPSTGRRCGSGSGSAAAAPPWPGRRPA